MVYYGIFMLIKVAFKLDERCLIHTRVNGCATNPFCRIPQQRRFRPCIPQHNAVRVKEKRPRVTQLGPLAVRAS